LPCSRRVICAAAYANSRSVITKHQPQPPPPQHHNPNQPAAYAAPDGTPANASLTTVCFKPFGAACATQSILQYWHMDRQLYESEQAKGPYSANKLSPDYCFGHW